MSTDIATQSVEEIVESPPKVVAEKTRCTGVNHNGEQCSFHAPIGHEKCKRHSVEKVVKQSAPICTATKSDGEQCRFQSADGCDGMCKSHFKKSHKVVAVEVTKCSFVKECGEQCHYKVADKLVKLSQLHYGGALTDKEFSDAKKNVTTPSSGGDVADKLVKLSQLHSGGALTDKEFSDAKKKVLSM